ncbi:MAG: orotate phosphoribosyltransferase [Candidatus Diapherotrites archaeon]|nr:orotate phosphoribosyltransferase [Candidatus Diapherotrites archaeon]
MNEYKKKFSEFLHKTSAVFFKKDLKLKDGRPTPYFFNIGNFNDGNTSYELGKFYADMIVSNNLHKNLDIIFGPSYKGSAIAQATTIALFKEHGIKVGFNYDRKEAKIHGEASGKKDMFVGAKFFNNCNVFMVDDVITTAGTKFESLEKIWEFEKDNKIKINLVGLGIAVDREQVTLEGENPIQIFFAKTKANVYAIAKATEIIPYLVEQGKLTQENLKEFQNYLKIYGVNK